jgi:hypothetical protein
MMKGELSAWYPGSARKHGDQTVAFIQNCKEVTICIEGVFDAIFNGDRVWAPNIGMADLWLSLNGWTLLGETYRQCHECDRVVTSDQITFRRTYRFPSGRERSWCVAVCHTCSASLSKDKSGTIQKCAWCKVEPAMQTYGSGHLGRICATPYDTCRGFYENKRRRIIWCEVCREARISDNGNGCSRHPKADCCPSRRYLNPSQDCVAKSPGFDGTIAAICQAMNEGIARSGNSQ